MNEPLIDTPPPPPPNLAPVFAKGCFGGLGMAILFFVISGGTYLILSSTTLAYEATIIISIATGPIIGTFGVLGILLYRSVQAEAAQAQAAQEATADETTSGDGA